MPKEAANVVTGENRAEFMAKRLKLDPAPAPVEEAPAPKAKAKPAAEPEEEAVAEPTKRAKKATPTDVAEVLDDWLD